MIIRISPPIISLQFLRICPNLLPRKKPRLDNRKVTIPIIITGLIIGTLNNPKVIPTARASMLVAIESQENLKAQSIFFFNGELFLC